MLLRALPHNSCIKKTATTRAARALPSTSSGQALPAKARGSGAQPTDIRLGRIVRLLMEHATVVVSGTKIAQEISSNRTEVWRLIQQLRGLGVDVAGHPATGYQLRSVPDLLLPEILAPLLRGTIFDNQLHHYYKIGSTNSAAMAAAAAGAPEGSVFLAEEQTAGRGIYCSVVLRPALPPSDVLPLTLAAGLAVRAAIAQVEARVSLDLKWPNDVLIKGRKVCGILTEMLAEPTRVRHIVVGIGINANQNRFPEEIESEATSLRIESGSECSRVELATALLKSLDREYRTLVEEPEARQSILQRFTEQSSWARGKQIRVDENGSRIEGTTEGLDEHGFLQVRTAQGLQRVLSGTVRAR